MTINAQLFDDKYVDVDDKTATLGGSFYYDPLRAYSPLPLRWAWEQLIKYPNATLIDVGASTGCYTLLSKHHPHLTVHAFEPVPLTNHILSTNVLLNDLSADVVVNSAGVSNYDGFGVMNVIKADGGKGVSILDGTPAIHKDCEQISVPVYTLDYYCDLMHVEPTMIKIDTEGGERFVLEGAKRTIEQFHPFILTEYSKENAYQYGYGADEIITLLESWGYVWTNPEGSDLWAVHLDWEKIGK